MTFIYKGYITRFCKKFIGITLICVTWQAAYSQELTQTIRGIVLDKQSQTPLPGAHVVLLDSTQFIGTATNVDGEFRLENLPIGRISLKVSYTGYEPTLLKNLILTSAKEMVLNIEIEENVVSITEAVVIVKIDKNRPLNDMSTVSARSINIEETQRFAGSFNDPARRAANYAGVNGSNDQRNDIIIRGNSPIGVLWRFEGLDIPNPNHFVVQGTNGGPVSILNNNLLANSDFFTGAFPAEYGNALSGVFDLRLRTGNNEKREFIGQIGFNGAEFLAEGPFSKSSRSSYLISYRYSTLDIFDKIGIDFGTAGIPRYQDLSFKLNFKTKKKGLLTFFGLGGISDISLLASEKEDSDNSFGVEDNEDVIFGTDMGVVGASYLYFFNENMYQKIIVGVSGSRKKVRVDTISATDNSLFNIYNDNSTQDKFTASYLINRKFNSRLTMRSGLIFDRLNLNLNEEVFNNSQNKFLSLKKFKGDSYFARAYIQGRYRFNNKLSVQPGLHFQQYFLNNSASVEPRLGFRWAVSARQTISLGYGFHSQTQMMEIYFYETEDSSGNVVRTNEDLGFTKSHHLVLGYDHSMGKNLRVKAETYYQQLSDIPVHGHKTSSFSAINLGTDFGGLPALDSLKNGGNAYNYGLEITLEKFFSRGYYFLLTSSLYESKYQGSDNIERNTIFNGNYIFNALAGVEINLGKANVITIDGKLTNAGGKRYTPIDLAASKLARNEVLTIGKAFSEQHEPYFRTDLKVTYRRNAKKVTHDFTFDIQNILNTENILLYNYNPATETINKEYQLGIFPVFQYRIEF
ncbi:MAG: TonB-dependent receptor [Bacteroidetes bacterium]|nr:TonB-dependent receptor [Bacteroidota bacterium]